MYVEVTLYKSGFSPSNVFVGDGVTPRPQSLLTLPRLSIPRCPFNPNDPFRLDGNAYAFQRKWDYAVFDLFTDDEIITPIFTQSFFVSAFQYVNDNVCRIIAQRDIVGDVFNDLSFAQILPEYYTFKRSVFTDTHPSKLANYDTTPMYAPQRMYYANSDPRRGMKFLTSNIVLGFVIVTCEIEPGKHLISQYIEDGIQYPFANLVFPFAYNVVTKEIDTHYSFRIETSTGSEINNISDIRLLEFLPNSKEQNFQILSSLITFDLGKAWGITVAPIPNSNNYTVTIKANYVVTSGQNTFDDIMYSPTNPASGNPVGFLYQLPKINITIDSISTNIWELRQPYKTLRIGYADKFVDIDPSKWYTGASGGLGVGAAIGNVFMSFVPPYKAGIELNFPNNIDSAAANYNRTVVFELSAEFTFRTDSLAQYLQSHYNSQITGLKVKQQTARDILQNNQTALYASHLASNLFDVDIVKAYTDFTLDYLQSATEQVNLALEQSAQNKLLQLSLQDIEAQPDAYTLNGSIGIAWSAQSYIQVGYYTNAESEAIRKSELMYGLPAQIYISSLKSHTRFDFIKSSNYDLLPTAIALSADERQMLFRAFATGIRLWYTLTDFLNFDIPNPETV